MLKNLNKNPYHMYYKKDVEDLGLPLYKQSDIPSTEDLYSKSWLQKELKIKLTEVQENNPHAFAQGKKGYYPVWDINKLKAK